MTWLNRSEIEEKANSLLHVTDTYRIPVSVEVAALRYGLTVEAAPLGEGVSGVLVIEDDQGNIGYNESHAPVRQRFTVAHELGHFILHKGEPETANLFIDKKITVFLRDEESSEGAKRREIEANQFAASLLMPAELVRKEIAGGEFDLADDGALGDLAQKFGVSAQALSIRLASLKLI